MGALLSNHALDKHEDLIRIFHRGQAMGNGDRRPPFLGLVQRSLHDSLTLRVQSRGRFVQQQQSWLTDERPCNGNALPLSTGQERSSGTALGGQTVWKRGDKIVDVGLATSVDDPVVCCIIIALQP